MTFSSGPATLADVYKSGGQSDKDEVTADSPRSVDLLKRLLMEVKVAKTFLVSSSFSDNFCFFVLKCLTEELFCCPVI